MCYCEPPQVYREVTGTFVTDMKVYYSLEDVNGEAQISSVRLTLEDESN